MNNRISINEWCCPKCGGSYAHIELGEHKEYDGQDESVAIDVSCEYGDYKERIMYKEHKGTVEISKYIIPCDLEVLFGGNSAI